jgi:ATP-dependent Lon protease
MIKFPTKKNSSKTNTNTKQQQTTTEIVVPVIALKNIVLLEKFIVPLFIENQEFISVIDSVMRESRKIFVITQKNISSKHLTANDLFSIGVYVNILQYLKLPDGTVKLLVEGIKRGKLLEIKDTQNSGLVAKISLINNTSSEKISKKDEKEIDILNRAVIEKFKEYMQIKTDIPSTILDVLGPNQDATSIIFNLLFHMDISVENKQKILELDSNLERLQYIYELLDHELEFFQLDKKIKNRVRKQIDKNQRDFYLNEQMKAIQKEMGKDDEDIEEIEKKLSEKNPPEHVRKKIDSEIAKLKKTQMISAEAGVIRNYIDWLLDVPWSKKEDINQDINYAKKVLDDEHYALEKVKERILEYLGCQIETTGKTRFSIPFNREELADYLCINRSVLSKELSRMQEDQLISFHKNQFEIKPRN